MKKRRPCTWNQSRSPKTSPRSFPRTPDSVLIRSKSFHDLKKRRLQRVVPKTQTKSGDHGEESNLKKDTFGSLETLFDVRKPLNLPEVLLPCTWNYGEGDTPASTPKSRSPRSPRRLVPPLFSDLPSDKVNDSTESNYKGDSQNTDHLKNITEETENLEFLESSNELKNLINMADEDNQVAEETGEEGNLEPENEAKEDEDQGAENWGEKEDEMGEGDKPPAHPIPSGLGEGVPVKFGGHRESAMSAIPLTDSQVMRELREADERCNVISKEIELLKKELTELTNKKDLTQEDTVKIKEKQESVMAKLGEFEKITRKLQRLLGLADPSSQTFARMFEMLPYPHKRDKVQKPAEKEAGKGELFDIPQMEYPEDKLPRVIICSYTEDNIPKIVVGDSERKEKCLQSLTGKLTESLNMQEKLVKENAQLEGGKYQLEEALLQKDNAVDSLQRKVCGLQAEMRIVVKENTELSRQLASLNQRVNVPNCCHNCSGISSQKQAQKYTASSQPQSCYRSSSPQPPQQQEDNNCSCKCCLEEQNWDGLSSQLPATVCVNPDQYRGSSNYDNDASPRLCGGACRGEQNDVMCCRSPATAKTVPVGQPRGACPAELENKLAMYGNNTKQLEQQLGSMECEVRNMQMELANVQRERQQLEQQRKLLKCTGPCAPCPCCPPSSSSQQQQQQMVPCGGPSPSGALAPQANVPSSMSMSVPMPLSKMTPQQPASPCSGPCINQPLGASTCPQQQLRDLREQYARLQDDYKSKLCEVSCLRTEAEKLKQETRDAREDKERSENRLIDLEERLKMLEAEKDKLAGSKEQLVEQEQALLVAKQRFREAQDELEELRSLIQDQASQLEDYRNKYLQAQQQVEEQRRQLELMEMDNARMNENVTLEIGRVKNHFQEKMAELAPLPDILKQTQVKLQEAQQMRLLAERKCEDFSRELHSYKDKMQTLQNQIDVLRTENQALQDERNGTSGKWEDLEKRNSELRNENERLKNSTARFEEHVAQMQKRIDEKMHEVTQLTAMLEQVREDSARQVARTKERCETVRRSMQGQIGEMERQLAQCRATARAAQKDRDEIRQKMQGQINNLNEAFEQAQGRIRSLQGHVNYLKNSYSNIFGSQGQGESPPGVLPAETSGQGQGYDSCDCNY